MRFQAGSCATRRFRCGTSYSAEVRRAGPAAVSTGGGDAAASAAGVSSVSAGVSSSASGAASSGTTDVGLLSSLLALAALSVVSWDDGCTREARIRH